MAPDYFDIDLDGLKAFQQQIGATDEEFIKAANRALQRTAVTLKGMTARMGKNAMAAKKVADVRKRLSKLYLRRAKDFNELKLWFGLNDMSVSRLRGRMSNRGSDARFVPKGRAVDMQDYENSFAGTLRGKRSIWRRRKRRDQKPKEQMVPIQDGLEVDIEDEILSQVPEIFAHHFMTDLRGRVSIRQ
ncbi:hypothetical protein [Algicola sagamiensis]|uniref:hypothetical protein n=1 Tax=Algicola sagamiensis TaxID=163869 RepID=UPI00036F5FA5|nr:hypothetical protein [Algicola sagamiensis]